MTSDIRLQPSDIRHLPSERDTHPSPSVPLKAVADYTTTSMDEDGIQQALRHFQLI